MPKKLIDYVNDRGGKVRFFNVNQPDGEWGCLLHAFQSAVALEKKNNASLLSLHRLASENNDPDLTNLLEEFYLREQVIEIQEMTRKANQLRRIGAGLGEHIFDRELLQEMQQKK
uniref:Ferritin n=1 Tax=Panagrolaimus superbus TaxID=310955 RepID=A0A914YL39_9BILA